MGIQRCTMIVPPSIWYIDTDIPALEAREWPGAYVNPMQLAHLSMIRQLTELGYVPIEAGSYRDAETLDYHVFMKGRHYAVQGQGSQSANP
jgi:hypothetical protein